MQLIKPITALLVVFLGQSNIFIQNYLQNQKDHFLHAKISAGKSGKQSVSRLPKNQFNLNINLLKENQENNQYLEIRIIAATVKEFLDFNFNSLKPNWFGCCEGLNILKFRDKFISN